MKCDLKLSDFISGKHSFVSFTFYDSASSLSKKGKVIPVTGRGGP
jgi:hypothetical protein